MITGRTAILKKTFRIAEEKWTLKSKVKVAKNQKYRRFQTGN